MHVYVCVFFFFKQKTAYEMRISDWSSDVCSSDLDAVMEAVKLRLRPIIMTSLAFILGMVPLVIASGAGAASRIAVGSGVMGGMIAATLLGIFFIPLFYLSVRKWISRKRPPAPAEKGHHEEPGHA